jgi:hypothetical protein
VLVYASRQQSTLRVLTYNQPVGPLCPLRGMTPGSLGSECELFPLNSSSGVCEDPVAWLLEDEQ